MRTEVNDAGIKAGIGIWAINLNIICSTFSNAKKTASEAIPTIPKSFKTFSFLKSRPTNLAILTAIANTRA